MEEVYYTPKEVAERLKVAPRTVMEWVRTGRLASVRAASFYRITESAIQEFLNTETPTTRGRKKK